MSDYTAATTQSEPPRALAVPPPGVNAADDERHGPPLRRKMRIARVLKVRLELSEVKMLRRLLAATGLTTSSELVRTLVRRAYADIYEAQPATFDGAGGETGVPPLPEIPR